MNTERKLTKAELIEIRWLESGKSEVVPGGKKTTVQFNPASLKVTYTNQVQTNDQSSSSAIQYVGKGSSKLALELIFDVSQPGSTGSGDVRDKTLKVAQFMEAKAQGSGEEQRYVAPGVRFSWGSFLFEGIIESLDETLDLWSEDGRPLRATVMLNLSQQGIYTERRDNPASTPAPPGSGGFGLGAGFSAGLSAGIGGGVGVSAGVSLKAGVTPMVSASAGASVQGLAAKAGTDWKVVAAANGIENPRRLPTGVLLNVNVKKP